MKQTYDWSLFRESDVRADIINEWEDLLGNSKLKELDYHKFLQSHPSIFLTGYDSYLVISKLKLGSRYETDFVIINEGYSDGTKYELLEIESPHTKLFNSKGYPTEKFNSALQQVRDWKRWLIDNKSEFRKIFPTSNTKVVRDSKITFKIIIGRRDINQNDIEKRRQISEENNIEIMSFDRLTEKSKLKQYFFNECLIHSAAMDMNIPYFKKNELANPFYECIKDSEWRKICYKGHAHIYSNLIDDILMLRSYNPRFEDYKKLVNFKK